MKKSDKKLVSRGIDGELSIDERVRFEVLVKTEPEALKTSRTWEAIGDQLRAESARIPVPDSTVAWQDIQRAIRLDSEKSPATPAASFGRLGWAGAFAGLVVIGLLAIWARMLITSPGRVLADHKASANRVEWVRAEIPGATTMIYTDTETDMTVIWMDVAQNVDPRDG
jgi:anti-sigma factor RsiW